MGLERNFRPHFYVSLCFLILTYSMSAKHCRFHRQIQYKYMLQMDQTLTCDLSDGSLWLWQRNDQQLARSVLPKATVARLGLRLMLPKYIPHQMTFPFSCFIWQGTHILTFLYERPDFLLYPDFLLNSFNSSVFLLSLYVRSYMSVVIIVFSGLGICKNIHFTFSVSYVYGHKYANNSCRFLRDCLLVTCIKGGTIAYFTNT